MIETFTSDGVTVYLNDDGTFSGYGDNFEFSGNETSATFLSNSGSFNETFSGDGATISSATGDLSSFDGQYIGTGELLQQTGLGPPDSTSVAGLGEYLWGIVSGAVVGAGTINDAGVGAATGGADAILPGSGAFLDPENAQNMYDATEALRRQGDGGSINQNENQQLQQLEQEEQQMFQPQLPPQSSYDSYGEVPYFYGELIA
jgi:hypothetical protein